MTFWSIIYAIHYKLALGLWLELSAVCSKWLC